jgi:hypothetical protein
MPTSCRGAHLLFESNYHDKIVFILILISTIICLCKGLSNIATLEARIPYLWNEPEPKKWG